MVTRKSNLLICDDYLQFQNYLQELRKLDDLIINTLNTPTSEVVASKECRKLGDEIFSRISYRDELISSCLARTNDLLAQNNSDASRRQTLVFQQRQLENERNFEGTIRANIEKAFYQRCRHE